MDGRGPEPALPPAVDAQLNILLRKWAENRRLSPTRAEDVRQAIRATAIPADEEPRRVLVGSAEAALARGGVAAAAAISMSLRTVDAALSRSALRLSRATDASRVPYRLYVRLV